MKNIMIENQRRNTMNKRKCPCCGMELELDVKQGLCDEYIVDCSNCGRYALSYEFYEDYIDCLQPRVNLSKIAAYLDAHKGKKRLLCICESKDTKSERYDCIAFNSI